MPPGKAGDYGNLEPFCQCLVCKWFVNQSKTSVDHPKTGVNPTFKNVR